VGFGRCSDKEVWDLAAAEPAIGELALHLLGASEVLRLDLDPLEGLEGLEGTDECVELGRVSR
jgi:hypothetical protein